MLETDSTTVEIVHSRDVRDSLVKHGDIREDIGFQNDINALIAAVDRPVAPWRALAGPIH